MSLIEKTRRRKVEKTKRNGEIRERSTERRRT